MNVYDLCCQHQGKEVILHEKCGRQHFGRIVKVDRQYVWLEKQPQTPNFGGFSYGFYGAGYPGYGFGGRNIFPIALGAIGGFALGTAFFGPWW
ncbi:hypothetical protein [Alkalihalobacterium bogoriense]|uniref:hypothetical protein n=1 Tax=Alkalihalobacterium bogoriense TaxID=246272 RepID=UPI00047E3613|nr:hypothetical protein [Alkalihalobacterium bogoriense]